MRRGQTLVATLIVIAILGMLAVALFKGPSLFGGTAPPARKDGKGTTVLGQVNYAARDETCKSNLGQVRLAIQVADPAGDQPPAELKELRLPAEFLRCPIGKEPYGYDPAAAKVWCPHPGHERY